MPQAAGPVQQLYSKMESYTPALVQKAGDFIVKKAQRGLPVRISEYQKEVANIQKRMETDQLTVMPLDPEKFLFKEWQENIYALITEVDEKERSLAVLFERMDSKVLDWMTSKKDKEEQKALAFYTSLVKSALIYYKNNEKIAISGLLDPYYNPKTGDYNILEARLIKNGWDRVACRLIIMAKYAALGSGLGGMGVAQEQQ